jgi:predicted transcriptional regulator
MDNLSETVAVIEKAAEIVVAYLARANVDANNLPRLVAEVRRALSSGEHLASVADAYVVSPAEPEPPPSSANKSSETPVPPQVPTSLTPAVRISDSIHNDYILSLEDGKPYRSLRRHLMAKYGMTPEEYRRKWGLPADYPMVAPSYSEERSQVAKRSGLGRSKAGRGEPTRSVRRK